MKKYLRSILKECCMPAELPVVSVWYLTSSSPLLHKGQGEINELANRLMDVRRVFCYHRTRLVSHPLRVSTLQAFASHHLNPLPRPWFICQFRLSSTILHVENSSAFFTGIWTTWSRNRMTPFVFRSRLQALAVRRGCDSVSSNYWLD